MSALVLATVAVALVAILAAFLLGRSLAAGKTLASVQADPRSGIELARFEERERFLAEQVTALNGNISTLRDQFDHQGIELRGANEKAAANDERISGLERALSREKEIGETAHKAVSAELADTIATRDTLQGELREKSQKLAAAERLETELRGQIQRAGNHISERDATIKELNAQILDVRSKLADRQSELATANEREAGMARAITEKEEQLKGLHGQLKAEFEVIANKILSATADQLSEHSKESLGVILDPLKTRITEFQQKIESTHFEDTNQRATLVEQIRQVATTSQSIGLQAENLTKALKGDSQLRGRWGEIRLERILEKSGLKRGTEFVVQGGDFNIKGEDGGSQRPDVIVLLPEDRHFIIDSKVSLVDYVDYEAAESDEARTIPLRKLLASVRGHIDGLAGKNYQHAAAINSHDLVFMFMPIEGVVAIALQADDSLFEYAWTRKVVMVCPSTLFMTMQTVAKIWRYERQNENAQAIADQAGQLYDKLSAVVGDLNDVSQRIQAAADSHADAMKKLSTGRGNALSRAQKLKSLGVASKKELPVVLLSGERLTIDADEDDDVAVPIGAPSPKLLEKPDGAEQLQNETTE